MKYKVGQVLNSKRAMTGYWMIMEIIDTQVIVSPLFWTEAIVYKEMPLKYLEEYQLHNSKNLSSSLKASYDHEKMRRVNRLNKEKKQGELNLIGVKR